MARFKNNFDFLRFIFAICVVITHSFALAGLPDSDEWMIQWTNNQVSFSAIGLSGFFTISGYFIYISLMRSDNLWIYLKKRFLRIFPGLFVVLLLSLCFVPFVYNGTPPLFKNDSFITYLPYNMSLYGFQGTISGVFENLSYRSINGSLWTIRYEFSLYIVLIGLFFIKSKKSLKLIGTATILLLMLICYKFNVLQIYDRSLFNLQGIHILNLGTFFVAGVLLAQLNFKSWKHSVFIPVVFLLILLALYLGIYSDVKHILFPVLVMSVGYLPIQILQRFSAYGDASYGIYIYSFPIQQLLVYYFSPSLTYLILYSISISVGFGYVSWHFVEEKALNYK